MKYVLSSTSANPQRSPLGSLCANDSALAYTSIIDTIAANPIITNEPRAMRTEFRGWIFSDSGYTIYSLNLVYDHRADYVDHIAKRRKTKRDHLL